MSPYNVNKKEEKNQTKQVREAVLKHLKNKGNMMILRIAILNLGSSQRPPFFLQILRLCTSEVCGPVFRLQKWEPLNFYSCATLILASALPKCKTDLYTKSYEDSFVKC